MSTPLIENSASVSTLPLYAAFSIKFLSSYNVSIHIQVNYNIVTYIIISYM